MRIVITLCFLILVACGGGPSVDDSTQIEIMPAIINDAIGISSDQELTQEQKLSISDVNCAGCEVTTLGGIEELLNLKSLNLSHSTIKDLTPLQNLTKLEYINLSDNAISDSTPLLTLIQNKREELKISQTEKIVIDLSNNCIEDLIELASQPNVELIGLEDQAKTCLSTFEERIQEFSVDIVDNRATFYIRGGDGSCKLDFGDGQRKVIPCSPGHQAVEHTYQSSGIYEASYSLEGELQVSVEVLDVNIGNESDPQVLEWAREITYSLDTQIKADNLGNVYVLGKAAQNSPNLFLTKFSKQGDQLWVQDINILDFAGGQSTLKIFGLELSIDAIGNVFIKANLRGIGSVRDSAFMIKFRPDGVKAWDYNIADESMSLETGDMVVDQKGNVFFNVYYIFGSAAFLGLRQLSPNGEFIKDHEFPGVLSEFQLIEGGISAISGERKEGRSTIVSTKFLGDGSTQWWTTIGDYLPSVIRSVVDADSNSYIAWLGADGASLAKVSSQGELFWKMNPTAAFSGEFEVKFLHATSRNTICGAWSGSETLLGEISNTGTVLSMKKLNGPWVYDTFDDNCNNYYPYETTESVGIQRTSPEGMNENIMDVPTITFEDEPPPDATDMIIVNDTILYVLGKLNRGGIEGFIEPTPDAALMYLMRVNLTQ